MISLAKQVTPRSSGDVVFVSGHLDLTEAEFMEHYGPLIARRCGEGCSFVVGDAPGADEMAQQCLAQLLGEQASRRVTVYHMLASPRRHCVVAPTRGGFTSDRERDEAMTRASVDDIAWVRPSGSKRHSSGTAQNLQRRAEMRRDAERNTRRGWPRFTVERDWDGNDVEFTRVEPVDPADTEASKPERSVPLPPDLYARLQDAYERANEAEQDVSRIEAEASMWRARQEVDPV